VSDRVASDHPSVTTHRTRLARHGGTRRPCLRLPDAVAGDVDDGDVVSLVIAGERRHAPVESDASGRFVAGAYDTRRLARDREGENRLLSWASEHGRGAGDAVELDAVEPGRVYGLRVPGRRTVYEAVSGPDASLSAIADRLDGDDPS
jgi:hypothetical protein